MNRSRKPLQLWRGKLLQPDQFQYVALDISESYSGFNVEIPLCIWRASAPGPVVFVTGALHGDEINGSGAIRTLLQDPDFRLLRGAAILVPVLNVLSFDRHSRYLPDRRDLNRCFPGTLGGSLASRMARQIFDQIVARCDYGIDLHTAAVRRTNYPTIRADLLDPQLRRLAYAFGAEVVLQSKGPPGSLRREATRSGCPTIVMEGGEVWKVEPSIVDATVRGIKNVFRELGMVAGELQRPRYSIPVDRTKWVRAERGGFLQFHFSPGEIVTQGQPLATNTDLLGGQRNVLTAPFDGVVLGMTTSPAVSPGEPVCHLGKLPEGTLPADLLRLRADDRGLEEPIREALASSVMVVDSQAPQAPKEPSADEGARPPQGP